MGENNIKSFFESYLDRERLFLDKGALQINYTPEDIPHREDQIHEISRILAPALKLEKPSNMFLYGKTGTGKTLSVLNVINSLTEVAKLKNIPLEILYVNCKLKNVADTEYRLIAHLARRLGETVPATGLPKNEVHRRLFDKVDEKERLIIPDVFNPRYSYGAGKILTEIMEKSFFSRQNIFFS